MSLKKLNLRLCLILIIAGIASMIELIDPIVIGMVLFYIGFILLILIFIFDK